jgi:hypothetical protein
MMSDSPASPIELDPEETERLQRLRRAGHFTAAAGTVFSVLTLASFFLLPTIPDADATSEEILRFTSDSTTSLIKFVALYLIPFACIAFVWFIVSLRMWIPQQSVRRVDVALSNVQLVSGIVFLVLFSASSAAMSISAIIVQQDDGTVGRVAAYGFSQYGSSLFFVFAIRMGAMFVFSTSGIGRQTGVLPRWVVYLGFAVGLVMLLSASFNRALIFTFPAWTLLISVLIWKHSRNLAMARLSSTPAVQTGQALFASRSSSDETMGEGDA